jgi:hypothetical protein
MQYALVRSGCAMIIHCSRKTSHSSIRGVGLIEMCLFIMALGLMVTAAAPMYKAYRDNKAVQATNNTMKQVRTALDTFKNRFGYLPCPAPRTAPIDGKSPEDGKPFGVSLTDCNSAAISTDGTTRVDGRVINAGASASRIRIGALPVRTLGLPDEYAVDAWGHVLTYAVTETYADINDPDNVPSDMLQGAIRIVDSSGTKVVDGKGNDPGGDTTKEGIAVYAVIAPGPDDRGAYALSGKMIAPCPTADMAADNCNDYQNGQFRATTLKSQGSSGKFTSNLVLRGSTCVKGTMTENLGNIGLLVDSSGSMGTADIDTGTKNKWGQTVYENRIDAAKQALDYALPLAGKAKATRDPSGIIGVADFTTYCSGLSGSALTTCQAKSTVACPGMTGATLDSCKAKKGYCDGLTGAASSQCLFNAFDTSTVDSAVSNSLTQTVSAATSTLYDTASTKLVSQVDNINPSGVTPLYDTMSQMANSMGNGTADKPNVLVVVSDGASNGDTTSNQQMIDTFVSKYPNTEVRFVFVGKSTQVPATWDTYTQAQKDSWCKSRTDDATCVKMAIFESKGKTTGKQLLFDKTKSFVQVQNKNDILSAIGATFGMCAQ